MINKPRIQQKMHLGRLRGNATKNNKLNFGFYGLQALSRGYITNSQIKAAKRVVTKLIKRNLQLWIKVFPDKSITARSPESRMGSGKGSIKYWVSPIKPGTILMELKTNNKLDGINALKAASYKLSIKTLIIEK